MHTSGKPSMTFTRGQRAARSMALGAVIATLGACVGDVRQPTDAGSPDDTALSMARTAASIVISPTSASGQPGDSVQFTATAYDRRGGALTGRILWTSSATAVVTVDSTGLAKLVAAGTARVTATYAGKSASATVSVTAAPTTPGTVNDLSVTAVTDTSATLRFTQVGNGNGGAASYDVRVAQGAMTWGTAAAVARGTCATPVAGTTAGSTLTCTVLGLSPSTEYSVQLVAFRGTLDVDAVFGALSNVATTTTAASGNPPPPPPPPSVFFTEGFEDAGIGSRGWYDNTSPAITTGDHAGAGAASLALHWAPGATVPANGAAMRHKFPASNSMYVAYDVKYSANFVGSQKGYHPHEFYALSSWDGDWDGLSQDWMTLYMEQTWSSDGGHPRLSMQDNKSINSLLGALPLSLLGLTEDRSTGGCNGMTEQGMFSECFLMPPWYNDKQLVGPVTLQQSAGPGYKNNWNHVEAFFQLNTVQNGVGQADGVMQAWFNGVLVLDRHDILFRAGARATLQLSQFIIAPYIGDGSPVDQTMWVDNLVVGSARP